MIKVVTDSTSYLEKKTIKDLDIQVMSLKVVFQEDTYREVDLENKAFYKMMEKRGIPKSSQPSIGEFVEVFTSTIQEGNEILGVFLSEKMSGTLSTAMMARDMVLKDFPEAKIELMDSESNCMQLGFAVEAGAKAAKEGRSLHEAKQAVSSMKNRSRFLFVPNNLKYLEAGGRIGKANALIGGLLSIIPILTVKDGETTIYKKVRRKKKAVDEMIEKMMADHKSHHLKEVVIHHIDAFEEAEVLVPRIKEKINAPIRILDIGPVIGLHVGPGAIGIVYHTEKEVRS
jgi:DegV family protein with EDD domain